MRLCPQCGTQNPPDATGCSHCGKALVTFDQTVVGFAAPQQERRFRGTMIGIAPLSAPQPGSAAPPAGAAPPVPPQRAEPTPPPPTPPPGGLRRTMIGMAAPSAGGQVAPY